MDFGIKIMECMHNNVLHHNRPMTFKEFFEIKIMNNNLMMMSSSIPIIAMASKESLSLNDRGDIINKIMLFGSFECLVKRLGLCF